MEDEISRALHFGTRGGGRDYWHWKDRPESELSAAETVLESAGLKVAQLTSRPRGDDPPDCEGFIDGKKCGIEVTELVHQEALRASIREGAPEVHFAWEQVDLLNFLQERIDRKDDSSKLKGGPYDLYILVIHTDELFLDRATVERFLTGSLFSAHLITHAYLGLSYDPQIRACPVFALPIAPRQKPSPG
jgi:hypothetical protein